MYVKMLLVILAATVCAPVFAQDEYRKKFTVPIGKAANLLHESTSLKIQTEETVQKDSPPSDLYMTLMAGATRPSQLTVSSNNTSMTYDFAKALPLVTAQVTKLPWVWHGRWGFGGSVGYSYGQYDAGDKTKTALHFLPLQAMAAYRGEFNSSQKLVPFAMAGPSLWSYFQRGTDQYNYSGSVLGSAAAAGIALNLNRMGWVSSRNESEITIQYQRQIFNATDAADFNGDSLQLGGTLAL